MLPQAKDLVHLTLNHAGLLIINGNVSPPAAGNRGTHLST